MMKNWLAQKENTSQKISSEIAIRTKITQLQQNDGKMFFSWK